MRLVSSEWHGPEIQKKMQRATGRAVIAIGENVATEAKMIAHVVTGTLRRSIHTAPRGYLGSGDEGAAQSANLSNVGMEGVSYEGAAALIEVGSWLSYACVEEVGRGHQFITPAVELVRTRAHSIFQQAVREEGL